MRNVHAFPHFGRTSVTATPPGLRAWQHRYIWWLRLSDAVLVVASIAFSQVLRFGSVTSGSLAGHTSVDYTFVPAAIGLGWLAAVAIYRTRSPRMIGTGLEEYRQVWSATLSLFGVIAVLSTIFGLDIARGYLAIALPLGLVVLTGNRWLTRKYVSARGIGADTLALHAATSAR